MKRSKNEILEDIFQDLLKELEKLDDLIELHKSNPSRFTSQQYEIRRKKILEKLDEYKPHKRNKKLSKIKMSDNKYILVAFPYPSGNGLHIGHSYCYAIMDSYCRYLKYQGYNVFQPFGFDSHGLPTENYAKKVGRDPHEIAHENINIFRGQMKKMNTNYQELLATSDPKYVKWTQWIFTKLKEHDLAYKKHGDVNWCNSCDTVLANEQVKDGKCERCSSVIEIKQLEQWYFRITKYKDRLIKNLEWLDYPESTKKSQLNWFENFKDWSVGRQRKFGAKIPIDGENDTLDTFVDSSFYHIRYCDPNNENELCAKDKYKQVDLYCAGSELSTNHLIYARFINMFLFDIDVVSSEEPFKRLIHNGMILNEGEKMSKTKGNTINPDDYPAGQLRMYLMFLAHFFDGGSWSDNNFKGIVRFDNRFKEWMSREGNEIIDIEKFRNEIFNYTEQFKFNKVISSFMTLVNQNRTKNLTKECKKELIDLISIYTPI